MADVTRRVEQLCRRYSFGGQAQLLALLEGINAEDSAPTTVRIPQLAVDAHVADSLVALDLPSLVGASSVVDMGSGAGFPGLPLAIAMPATRMTLLESHARKCRFIKAQVSRAGIANACAVWARAEEWREGFGAHDVALARAVGPPPLVLEYAAPLLRIGGALIDWRSRRDPDKEGIAERVARLLGLERVSITRVEPFEGAEERHLHLYLKVRDTPARFPRRAGMARKRPLSG